MTQPSLFPTTYASSLNGAAPVLKWAGGKGQLLPTLRARFPQALRDGAIRTYAEPFVGGGAVFFDLVQAFPRLERAFLFDVNPELIVLYSVLQRDVDALVGELGTLRDTYLPLEEEERKTYFYRVRKAYNSAAVRISSEAYSASWVSRAARTIFLNRTCFNGLFRVNSKGEFNVPFGRNGNPAILDEGRLRAASTALQRAEVQLGDFSDVGLVADKGTFVYYDPPYRPISNTSSFNSYMKGVFNDDAQRRLAAHFRELDERGVKQLLSNSDPTNYGEDSFFDDLYRGFTIERIEASRMINSKASKRGAVRELLIRNYES